MMQCCGPETQAPHDAGRGVGGWKSPWKKAGKTMEKRWENPGKTRKSEENHGTIPDKWMF